MRDDGRVADAAGIRLANGSVACALAVIPAFVVLEVVGGLLMAWLGVAEGDAITTAGAAGWIAGIALAVLLPLPQVVGLVLGVRARRRGGGRRALAGIIANAAIGGWLAVATVAGLLLA